MVLGRKVYHTYVRTQSDAIVTLISNTLYWYYLDEYKLSTVLLNGSAQFHSLKIINIGSKSSVRTLFMSYFFLQSSDLIALAEIMKK